MAREGRDFGGRTRQPCNLKGDSRRVNDGFLVLSPKIGQYLKDDTTVWEQEPLEP